MKQQFLVQHCLLVLLAASLVYPTCSFSSINPVGQISQTIQVKSRGGKKKKAIDPEGPPELPLSDLDAKQDETVVEFIRSEYKSWVLQHNKTEDDKRFEIFKGNFLATLKAFESTGKYHALNEFADLTPEEFKKEKEENPKGELESYVRSEYETWAKQYNKPTSAERYKYFKTNFLMTMKMFEETGKFNALNEHGDMSREEFLRMQTKMAISGSRGDSGIGSSGYASYSEPAPAPPPSYSRPAGMTFTPVSPKSTSDVLNNGGGSSSGSDDYGMGGGSSGYMGGSWSDSYSSGRGGNDGFMSGGATSYRAPAFSAPSPAPAPSYSRPEGMTFTPVSPKSTSDVLNNNNSGGSSDYYGGSSYGSSSPAPMGAGNSWGAYQTPPAGNSMSGYGGMGMGSMSASSYDRPSDATFTPITPGSQSDMRGGGGSPTRGKSASDNWAGKEWGVPPPNYYDVPPSPSGRAQPPMYSPPASYPTPAPSYDRPSEMTFTPVTPKSTSDVLNPSSSSSSGDSDTWPGMEWGAPPPRSRGGGGGGRKW